MSVRPVDRAELALARSRAPAGALSGVRQVGRAELALVGAAAGGAYGAAACRERKRLRELHA